MNGSNGTNGSSNGNHHGLYDQTGTDEDGLNGNRVPDHDQNTTPDNTQLSPFNKSHELDLDSDQLDRMVGCARGTITCGMLCLWLMCALNNCLSKQRPTQASKRFLAVRSQSCRRHPR